MLNVRHYDENLCATFCGKPVESVESVENAHSAKKEEFIKSSSACAPHDRALKRYQNKGVQTGYKTKKSLKKLLACDKIESESGKIRSKKVDEND